MRLTITYFDKFHREDLAHNQVLLGDICSYTGKQRRHAEYIEAGNERKRLSMKTAKTGPGLLSTNSEAAVERVAPEEKKYKMKLPTPIRPISGRFPDLKGQAVTLTLSV